MKFHTAVSGGHGVGASGSRDGFTLPEVMVAMTVFILLLGGVLFAHLFGLSLFRLTETKLSATDDARQTIGRMADEIRSCKSTWIGNVKNGVFEAMLDGETQQGSALMILPTTNTANYIIYFVNPSDKTFRRTTGTGSTSVLAESVTNSVVFRAQDHRGTVLTNNQNNRVVHLNLEFYQPQRHLQRADYFKLETSVTRRALE
jgi:prepilin-type N-terminal cleavage/methylation domain-containing protein